MAISLRSGMGAIPYDDPVSPGSTFRVWAPYATSVAVAGTFNGWSSRVNPLTSEGNGYWSADVPGAVVSAQYKLAVNGNAVFKMDPYARSIVHDTGGNLNAVIAPDMEDYDATLGYSTPPWNEMVIYELHVRTFLYGSGYKGSGSFADVITKLDYLRDLGINVIEIMPLGEFLGDISSGYNPCYIFAVEDEFGGPDGLRKFVNEAHARGIAVIVDVVYNHLAPGDLYRFDGWSENGLSGIYFYSDWRIQTAWGDRFDYGRPQVRQYLRDNALRWVQGRYADGLRFDSVGSIRNVKDQNNDPGDDLPDGWSLLQWINQEVRQQPWKLTIAEDLKENEWITKSDGAGGAGFGAQWGSHFMWSIRNAVIASDDASRNMDDVAFSLGQKYNNDAFQRIVCSETHDSASYDPHNTASGRVPLLIWPGKSDSWFAKKRSTLAAAAVMTAPGIPMIFMGQEFLNWENFNDSLPLDWSNSGAFSGITQLYRDLIHLRRNWFNNTRGLKGQNINVHHVDHDNKVIAFHRWQDGGGGDDVIIVLNFGGGSFSNYSIGFPRSGHWQIRFNSDWNGYDPYFSNWFSYGTDAYGPSQDLMPTSGNVGFAPYSAIILSQ